MVAAGLYALGTKVMLEAINCSCTQIYGGFSVPQTLDEIAPIEEDSNGQPVVTGIENPAVARRLREPSPHKSSAASWSISCDRCTATSTSVAPL